MPTYEYLCEKCGFEFEQFQRMSAEPLKTCPRCRQASVKRKISGGAGVIFKGSGFYVNDYGGKRAAKSPVKTPSKETATSDKNSKEKTTTESTEKPNRSG
ncbi:MAG: zinc ribbon domain-containing protein [Candidatus Marinimicrobia bacterium]|jgi:putative FmdB family regulatory protein|nr:zinc ribbon domain-containing protein [Candidatus Neomarinimicrobiota bacterium]MCK9483465.1 zinc ribbon domain-containing protein [Candidatus Neomarinimicrobiota bacterium]MCK9560519.1 zinc ribbon domain-containing protein [Candidatus Neomarinimicrobiota bacterium]